MSVFCVCKDNNNYQAILVCQSIKLANFCLLTGLSHLSCLFIRGKHFSIRFGWIVLSDSVSGIRDPLMCEAMLCWHHSLPYLATKSDVNLANLTVISLVIEKNLTYNFFHFKNNNFFSSNVCVTGIASCISSDAF